MALDDELVFRHFSDAHEWDDDDDYDDEIDMDEEWPFDCGMDRSGQCSMAGSEDCEFECPLRRETITVRKEEPAK